MRSRSTLVILAMCLVGLVPFQLSWPQVKVSGRPSVGEGTRGENGSEQVGTALVVSDAGRDSVRAQAPSAFPPADAFAALRWRSIGPNRGGRSIAVAGSVKRPLEYFFGATGGGVWKTVDGGVTWEPVSDRFFKTSSVGALAVAPSNPDVVYAGMGETELRGNIIQGDGVYKSTDAGKTWTHVGLERTRAISRIRVHPANPDLVFVAAFGEPYGPTADRGVFRSRDGGKTWEKVLFRNEQAGAIDLVMDPKSPDVLYAGLWEAFRTPHSLSSGGPGSGLFKSTDGGTTWTEITRHPGMPEGIWGKTGIAVGPDSSRVYALIEATEGGLYRSDDAGATWTLVNGGRELWQRAFYFLRTTADPVDRDTVYVLSYELLRSRDGGKTFEEVDAPHSDHHDLWIAANDPARMINGNDGGGNVSTTGGRTWTAQDYPTAQLYHAVTTRHVPYHVCGAQQDNSTICVPSSGGGDTSYAVGGGESGYVAPDPSNTNVFYAGSYGGYLTRLDRVTGQSRLINVWPEYPVGQSARDLKERFQWTFPIIVSPTDPKVLYVGSQHVWKSVNGGQSWTRISPDLTRADPATLGPSGGPLNFDQTGVETYATVFTIAPSRVDPNVIWAGSDDGLVHVTRDAGKSWEKVTPAALPEFTRISLIEASPHRPGAAYLAGNRYQKADLRPYVFKTEDYGRTWTAITGGLPADDFPREIREDPKKAGLLYLGTEHGFYISFDAGASWRSLRLNLPVTPVHGVIVEGNDLVIATHGRSAYVLDNIAFLRQLTPESTSATWLFEPSDVTRFVNRGATIDYYLKGQPSKVQVEILDAQGAIVNRFAEPPEPIRSDKDAGFSYSSRAPVPRLPAKAGMNRFTWNLRYANARDFPGLIMYGTDTRGPLVPPGTYRIRLTADGVTRTQTVTVRKDPRLADVTDADLQEQARFALEIQEKFSATNDAVVRIRTIRGELADRAAQRPDAKLKAMVDGLTNALTEIEGKLYQYRHRSQKSPLNFPNQLNNKLAVLRAVVDSADSRPTDQSYEVFKGLSAQFDQHLGALDALLKKELPPLNKRLQQLKLAPVTGDAPVSRPTFP